MPFSLYGPGNAKVGSQEIPGVTGKFGLGVWNEAGQRLTDFCEENALVIANTLFQQHKRKLYTWTSRSTPKSFWLYFLQRKMEKLYTVSQNKIRADYGSNHELLIAKFRLKLKKVWKTTRPFRYDLNQIPYDYMLEVTNRFKGLALIKFLKNYGQELVTLYRRLWSKSSPRKRNAKRQNGC